LPGFLGAVVFLALAGCRAAEPIPGVRVTVPPTLTIAPTLTHTPGWWETVAASPTLTGTATVTATRTVTGTRAPTPVPWREQLAGKIVFVTDRDGWEGSLYVMEADGSHQQPLRVLGDDFFGSGSEAFYRAERERQTWNPRHVWQVYVADLPGGRPQLAVVNLHPQDPNRGGHWDLTFHDVGSAYDPTWQPNGNWIAYVSDDTGNDEIWKIHAHRGRGSEVQLTHNTWEWDKFPSWSPDGRQIAFYSNRDGHEQIYVMGADGTDSHNLSNNPYNDREPVWLRPLRSGTPTPIPTGTARAH
jgi:hypothetical protein